MSAFQGWHNLATIYKAEPAPFADPTGLITDQSSIFNSSLVRDVSLPPGATVNQLDSQPMSSVSAFKELSVAWYSDQVLPFDVTLAFTNEYGSAAACKIYAIELLNEGYGISIDDAVSEMQATFVARGISPLQSVGQVAAVQFAKRMFCSLQPGFFLFSRTIPLARATRPETRTASRHARLHATHRTSHAARHHATAPRPSEPQLADAMTTQPYAGHTRLSG